MTSHLDPKRVWHRLYSYISIIHVSCKYIWKTLDNQNENINTFPYVFRNRKLICRNRKDIPMLTIIIIRSKNDQHAVNIMLPIFLQRMFFSKYYFSCFFYFSSQNFKSKNELLPQSEILNNNGMRKHWIYDPVLGPVSAPRSSLSACIF